MSAQGQLCSAVQRVNGIFFSVWLVLTIRPSCLCCENIFPLIFPRLSDLFTSSPHRSLSSCNDCFHCEPYRCDYLTTWFTWLDPPKLLLFRRSSLFWPLLVLVPRPERTLTTTKHPAPRRPPPTPTHFFLPPRHKTNKPPPYFEGYLVYILLGRELPFDIFYLGPVYCLPSFRDLSSIFSSQVTSPSANHFQPSPL